jgi:hypothetical protein
MIAPAGIIGLTDSEFEDAFVEPTLFVAVTVQERAEPTSLDKTV